MDPDHTPGVARTIMQAAGMRVILLEGGTIQEQEYLSEFAIASLSTVLAQVKGNLEVVLLGSPLAMPNFNLHGARP